jgi:hypothetical protein
MAYTCEQCGFEDDSGQLERRREKHLEVLCSSCLAKPARTVRTKYGLCRPHRGTFDNNDNPLDRWNRAFRPGFRLCGNRDCIEPTHIVSDEQLKG